PAQGEADAARTGRHGRVRLTAGPFGKIGLDRIVIDALPRNGIRDLVEQPRRFLPTGAFRAPPLGLLNAYGLACRESQCFRDRTESIGVGTPAHAELQDVPARDGSGLIAADIALPLDRVGSVQLGSAAIGPAQRIEV